PTARCSVYRATFKNSYEICKVLVKILPVMCENPSKPFPGRFQAILTIILQFLISFLKKGRYSYIQDGNKQSASSIQRECRSILKIVTKGGNLTFAPMLMAPGGAI